MAANTAGVIQNFRKELLCGSHAFGSQAANGTRTATTKDVFAIALYRVTSGIGIVSTNSSAYAVTNEVSATGEYAAGGRSCANATEPNFATNTSYWTPSASVSWTNVTMTGTNATDLAMLYNSSSTGKLAVATFLLGTQDVGQAPSAGTFTLTMPTNDQTTGLIRVL